jgi:hypothetical protein
MIMLRSDDDSLPLSAAEIMNLTNQLNNLEYEVITKMDKIIMAIRVDRSVPDLMEDIEKVYHQLDERDTQDLSHVVLIGNEEVILVKPDFIKALMNKRSEDENLLIFELREKLDRDFGQMTFKDERDPYGTNRFAVRVPMETVVREPSQMHNALTKAGGQLNADVFYIIGDSNFIRLNRQSAATLIDVGEAQKINVERAETGPDPKPVAAIEPAPTPEQPPIPKIHPPLSSTPPPQPVQPPEVPKMEPAAEESVSRFAEHFIDDERKIEPTASRIGKNDSFDLQSELAAFMNDRNSRRGGDVLLPRFERQETDMFETPIEPESLQPENAPALEPKTGLEFPDITRSGDAHRSEPHSADIEKEPEFDLPAQTKDEEIEELLPQEPEPEKVTAFELSEVPKDEDIEELLPPEPEPEQVTTFDLPAETKDEDIEELLPPKPEPEQVTTFDLPAETKDEDIEELLPPKPEPEQVTSFDLPAEAKDEDIEELLPPEPEPEIMTSELSQDSLEKFESKEPEEISPFIQKEPPETVSEPLPEPEPDFKALPPKIPMKIATKMPVKMVVKKPAPTFTPKLKKDGPEDKPEAEEESIDTSSLPPVSEVPDMPVLDPAEMKAEEPEIDESELKTLLPEPDVTTEEPPFFDEPPEPILPPSPGGANDPPLERIASALKESHFELVLDVSIDSVDIVVRSEQGKYEKIFVKYVEECTLDTVNEVEKIVEFYKGDIALIIGRIVPELITAFTLPEKIRVFSLDEFEKICRERKLLTSD